MPDNLEIERKFLVVGEAWRMAADDGEAIRQGYLAINERLNVRVRLIGQRARLTIKAARSGSTRQEFEYDIPVGDAEILLGEFCDGPPIEKRRFRIAHAGAVWEVDVFAGANAGLVLAEIELERADQKVDLPPWVGPEVTDDKRFYNAYLYGRPFKSWGQRFEDVVRDCADNLV